MSFSSSASLASEPSDPLVSNFQLCVGPSSNCDLLFDTSFVSSQPGFAPYPHQLQRHVIASARRCCRCLLKSEPLFRHTKVVKRMTDGYSGYIDTSFLVAFFSTAASFIASSTFWLIAYIRPTANTSSRRLLSAVECSSVESSPYSSSAAWSRSFSLLCSRIAGSHGTHFHK